jgi:hypothetical protein
MLFRYPEFIGGEIRLRYILESVPCPHDGLLNVASLDFELSVASDRPGAQQINNDISVVKLTLSRHDIRFVTATLAQEDCILTRYLAEIDSVYPANTLIGWAMHCF